MCMCVKMWIRNEFVVFLLNLFVTVENFLQVSVNTYSTFTHFFCKKTKTKQNPTTSQPITWQQLFRHVDVVKIC